jgi:hypothetical protein
MVKDRWVRAECVRVPPEPRASIPELPQQDTELLLKADLPETEDRRRVEHVREARHRDIRQDNIAVIPLDIDRQGKTHRDLPVTEDRQLRVECVKAARLRYTRTARHSTREVRLIPDRDR